MEYFQVILQSSKHLDKADEYRFLHPWLGTGLLTRSVRLSQTNRKEAFYTSGRTIMEHNFLTNIF